jgi:hypothetical protein
MPNFLPKLGWLRYTPFPKRIVVFQSKTIFFVHFGHKIMDLSCLRGRRPPKLLALGIKRFVDMRHD